MATGEDMKRIRTSTPTIRKRRWPQNLPADPRDADVVRAKALAPARLIADQEQGKTAAIAVDNRGGAL
jgi:hypothetical protein